MTQKSKQKELRRKKRKVKRSNPKHKDSTVLVNIAVGRLDRTRRSSPDDFIAMITAGPVPEDQWHLDDRDEIEDTLSKMDAEGMPGDVYRRDDGTYTFLTHPEFIGNPDDFL